MTYLESAECIRITRDRAYIELKRHDLQAEWLAFLAECITWPDTELDDEGNITMLSATKLLVWLGY